MMDRLSSPPSRIVTVLTFTLLFATALRLAAQSADEGERERIQARISELEAQLLVADHADDIYAELTRLRSRLVDGDFGPGDAVAIEVVGDSALTDTFTVEVLRELRLPGLEPLDLTGVLVDELQPYLEAHVSRFVRDPTVVAHPLIRVAVTGAVSSPGYYMVRPETPALDVFGAAGGFNNLAKTNDVELRRSGKEIVDSKELRQAMAAGWSLQQLEVRSADEFHVPEKPRPMTTREWVMTVTGLVGVGLALFAVFN
ncbi:MAG: SLBB domain-containing protein [Gemmatimonadota bacterium]|nr:MAG: SLBB domain-containing protein [Gemmatimonadota bacterium]